MILLKFRFLISLQFPISSFGIEHNEKNHLRGGKNLYSWTSSSLHFLDIKKIISDENKRRN